MAGLLNYTSRCHITLGPKNWGIGDVYRGLWLRTRIFVKNKLWIRSSFVDKKIWLWYRSNIGVNLKYLEYLSYHILIPRALKVCLQSYISVIKTVDELSLGYTNPSLWRFITFIIHHSRLENCLNIDYCWNVLSSKRQTISKMRVLNLLFRYYCGWRSKSLL